MNGVKRHWSVDVSAGQQGSAMAVTELRSQKFGPFANAREPGVLLIALTMLSLGGCGDNDESTGAASSSTSSIEGVTEEQLDAAVDQTRNRVKDALEAQGIGSETAKGGYAVGGELDGESFSMGVDLDAPEWLPAEFPLPQDLSISMVTTNKEGQRELLGKSAGVTQSNIAELAGQWAASHNWEVVRSTDTMLTLASSDGQVLDVRADDGAELELRLSRRDLSHDRQQVAVERRGPGSAVINMDGDTRTVAGECLIKGSSYQFEYSAPDGSVFTNVQIQDANNTPTGSASFMTNSQGRFAQFSINFPMNDDNEPVVSAAGNQFSVSGMFVSMGGGSLSGVDGNISVNCEF